MTPAEEISEAQCLRDACDAVFEHVVRPHLRRRNLSASDALDVRAQLEFVFNMGAYSAVSQLVRERPLADLMQELDGLMDQLPSIPQPTHAAVRV